MDVVAVLPDRYGIVRGFGGSAVGQLDTIENAREELRLDRCDHVRKVDKHVVERPFGQGAASHAHENVGRIARFERGERSVRDLFLRVERELGVLAALLLVGRDESLDGFVFLRVEAFLPNYLQIGREGGQRKREQHRNRENTKKPAGEPL